MEKKLSWKNSTNPREIMELIKDSKTVDKYNVLAYFGQTQKDLKMLNKLLQNKNMKTPQIIQKYSKRKRKKQNTDGSNIKQIGS